MDLCLQPGEEGYASKLDPDADDLLKVGSGKFIKDRFSNRGNGLIYLFLVKQY
jgi:hypothetical protein